MITPSTHLDEQKSSTLQAATRKKVVRNPGRWATNATPAFSKCHFFEFVPGAISRIMSGLSKANRRAKAKAHQPFRLVAKMVSGNLWRLSLLPDSRCTVSSFKIPDRSVDRVSRIPKLWCVRMVRPYGQDARCPRQNGKPGITRPPGSATFQLQAPAVILFGAPAATPPPVLSQPIYVPWIWPCVGTKI